MATPQVSERSDVQEQVGELLRTFEEKGEDAVFDLMDALGHALAENVPLATAELPRGETWLHVVARYGDTPLALMLLRAGCLVDAMNSGGQTALAVAAAHGQAGVAQALLAAGADSNAPDAQGSRPLYAAVLGCIEGGPVATGAGEYGDAVESLLAAGADPTLRTLGRSAVELAMKHIGREVGDDIEGALSRALRGRYGPPDSSKGLDLICKHCRLTARSDAVAEGG